MTRRTLVADVGAGAGHLVGPSGPLHADLVIRLGAAHPSSTGTLRLRLEVDDGDDGPVVVAAEPRVGFLHRGAEKLFEVRDYRQAMVLANRHDWLSAFVGELGLALVVERVLGLEVPPRAVWLRTLLAELQRALHHLAFLGGAPADDPDVLAAAGAGRESLQEVLEELTGGRVHPMATQLGGLKVDAPAGWTGRCGNAVDTARGQLADVRRRLADDEAFGARADRIGVLDVGLVDGYGLSGPVARASGATMDLRRDDPALAYPELDVPLTTRTAGDVRARYDVLGEGAAVALDLIDACLAGLPRGPVNVRLPKTVRAPEGHAAAWLEAPGGIAGWYLVSRGDRVPYRLKMRTPSFAAASTLPAVLPGTRLEDVAAVLGSLFLVVGDLDK